LFTIEWRGQISALNSIDSQHAPDGMLHMLYLGQQAVMVKIAKQEFLGGI